MTEQKLMQDGISSEKESLMAVADIKYITPENGVFRRTAGNLVALTFRGMGENGADLECPRVLLHRSFPFTMPMEYLSVQDTEFNEIGMIRDLRLFDGETQALLMQELERKYFCPEIVRVISVKERFSYSYWEVETSAGAVEFAVHDTFRNIIRAGNNRVLILDVDGNRYNITDTDRLDAQSLRKIEMYL